MKTYTENQQTRLLAIANRPLPMRCIRGTDRLTEKSLDGRRIIEEAKLLLGQANTAGGWHILKNEISNFLYRAE